jgi:phosphatidate cytidylyltransferase
MVMADKISTRQAYGNTLVKLGAENPDIIVLDADLSKSTMTAGFKEAFPDRFFNAGIAEANMMGMAAGTIFIMSVYVFTFPRFKAQDAFAAIAGLTYVALLMSFLYQVRILEDSLWIIPLVFISAWGNDTCAYCVGVLIGKHKMFPVLSPKKSVEGFIGGIAGAAVLGLIYGLVFGKNIPSLAMPAAGCTLICGIGALIAVVGDLAASAIKRDAQIKDYGKLIPGHGGILDRFDSILFTAPAVFILAVLLGA